VKLDVGMKEGQSALHIRPLRITALDRVEDLEHHFDILLVGTHDWLLTIRIHRARANAIQATMSQTSLRSTLSALPCNEF